MRTRHIALVALLALPLAACGGGSTPTAAPAPTGTMFSGKAAIAEWDTTYTVRMHCAYGANKGERVVSTDVERQSTRHMLPGPQQDATQRAMNASEAALSQAECP